MRFLIALVTILAGLYGGYWFIGRSAMASGVESFLVELRSEGWEVNYSGIDTRGFPSRFDTTISDLSLYHPASGTGWEADWLQLFALSYRPNRVIVVWPVEQYLQLPGERLTVTSGDLRASAGVKVSTALALDAVTVDGRDMVVASENGWEVELGRALFAFRAAGPGPADYDLFLELSDLAPPPETLRGLDETAGVPETIGTIRLDTGLTLQQPLDRHLSEPVTIDAINLRDTRMIWGDVEVSGSGQLEADEAGFAEGRVALGLTNWDSLLNVAVTTGAMLPGLATGLSRALDALSQDGETVLAPFTFEEGRISFGFLNLGPAPQLR